MTEGKDTTCVSSLCDVEVDENAHQIHLRALQSESVIAQDSIYVPAVAESEFYALFQWLTFHVCY